ncbi:MAG: hypothetical protein K5679_05785 [Lachnospiraceae bacterium]|nr:hypothetical protein [Lachnospiraceae bacterium]
MKKFLGYASFALIICLTITSVLYFKPIKISDEIVCVDEEDNSVSVKFDYEYHRRIPQSHSFYTGSVTVDGVAYYSPMPHQRYEGMGCEFYSQTDSMITADRVRVIGGFEEDADWLSVTVSINGESCSYYYTRK